MTHCAPCPRDYVLADFDIVSCLQVGSGLDPHLRAALQARSIFARAGGCQSGRRAAQRLDPLAARRFRQRRRPYHAGGDGERGKDDGDAFMVVPPV